MNYTSREYFEGKIGIEDEENLIIWLFEYDKKKIKLMKKLRIEKKKFWIKYIISKDSYIEGKNNYFSEKNFFKLNISIFWRKNFNICIDKKNKKKSYLKTLSFWFD